MSFWGSPRKLAPKILGDEIAFAAKQLYAKIKFQCFVV